MPILIALTLALLGGLIVGTLGNVAGHRIFLLFIKFLLPDLVSTYSAASRDDFDQRVLFSPCRRNIVAPLKEELLYRGIPIVFGLSDSHEIAWILWPFFTILWALDHLWFRRIGACTVQWVAFWPSRALRVLRIGMYVGQALAYTGAWIMAEMLWYWGTCPCGPQGYATAFAMGYLAAAGTHSLHNQWLVSPGRGARWYRTLGRFLA